MNTRVSSVLVQYRLGHYHRRASLAVLAQCARWVYRLCFLNTVRARRTSHRGVGWKPSFGVMVAIKNTIIFSVAAFVAH
eukprot:1230362-Lingulodinium_polyedra.AAC.1